MRRVQKSAFIPKMPDDVQYLLSLKASNLLFSTPAQDYDDSYALAYARAHGAFLVSNDRYRDQFETCATADDERALDAWLRTHLISFTFIGDEFMPNPDRVAVLNTRVCSPATNEQP
jgi:hypothetical protein